MNNSGVGAWSFPPADGSTIPRTVQFTPRLLVNSVRAAVASAVEDAAALLSGRRACIVTPEDLLSVPKVRVFVDFAVPRLRAQFACLGAAPAPDP
jgi:hypothetical protein